MPQVDAFWFAARGENDLDDSLSDSPKDVYEVVNKDGDSIFVEAAPIVMLAEAGVTRLNIEDNDLADLRDHLDVDGDRKLERRELESANFELQEGVRLVNNDAFRSEVTQKLEASGVRFRWNSPKNILGRSRSGLVDC